MTHKEVVKWLESLKKEIGKAENRTLWHYAESIDMAIEALNHSVFPNSSDLISKEDVKWQIQEWIAELSEAIDMLDSIPSADRPKNMIHIDEVYRLIAGHSNYHGDSILSAFTCLVEGKDVKPIAPLDESAEPELIMCKDCKYFDRHTDTIEMYQTDGFCMDWARDTYEDWYCSRAERSRR